GHDQLAAAWLDVAFEMENLLPGAEDQSPSANGNRQAGAHDRRLEMRMGISIMPGLLVAILATGGNQFVEDVGEVLLQARLELDGSDGCRRSNVKDVGQPGADPGALDHLVHFPGSIMEVAMPLRLDVNRFLVDHGSF